MPGENLHIEEIVAYLRSRVDMKVDIAIVCGSGLSELVKAIEHPTVVAYEDIPYFPASTVEGE